MNATPPRVRPSARPGRPILPPPLPNAGGQRWSSIGTDILFVSLCVLLVAHILLFSYLSACLGSRNPAEWGGLAAGILMIAVSPVVAVGCCALAFALLQRRAYRHFAMGTIPLAFVLGYPPIALRLAAWISEAMGDWFF
jgi:hypothetical protein